MTTPTIIKAFLVFVAHPDDVSAEIEIVKDVCKIISEQQRPSQISVEARHFEDLLPSGGKPQRYINKELINQCHVFIGIMNKSVGKGRFAGELKLGLKRFEKEKIPFCLYVKQDESTTSRNKLLSTIKDKCKYNKFANSENLRNQLIIHLGQIINSYSVSKPVESKAIQAVSNIKSPPQRKIRKSEPKKQKDQSLLGPNESKAIIPIYNKAIRAITKKVGYDDFEKIRLFLHASALLYNKKIPSEILGNHEIQLLYIFKEKINPSNYENKLILRTLIADQFHHKAGWFWLKHIKKADIFIYFCLHLLRHDSAEDVRIGALTMLDKFWKDNLYQYLDGIESDQAEGVKIRAMELLKNHPSKKSIQLLAKYASDSSVDVKKKAKQYTFKILSKTDVHAAITMIINNEEIDYYSIDKNVYHQAFDAELRKLLQHKNENVSIDALEELIRRNLLTKDELIKLIGSSTNWDIRYLALDGLLQLGERIQPSLIKTLLKDQGDPIIRRLLSFRKHYEETDLLIKVYRNLTVNELEELLDWGYEGSYIYQVLMTKFYKQKENELRQDLEDNFNKRKQSLLTRMAAAENTTLQAMDKAFEEVNDFVRRNFIQAALRVLLHHNDQNALKFARRFVAEDNNSLQELCYDIIAKFGSENDATFLFETAKRLNNYRSKQLLLSALKLDSAGKHNIIKNVLELENPEMICVTLAFCITENIKIDVNKPLSLLHHKDDSIRKHAVAYLMVNLNKSRLNAIQQKYYRSETYFYNVVSYLDMFLYAPRKIKQKSVRDLLNQITSKIR